MRKETKTDKNKRARNKEIRRGMKGLKQERKYSKPDNHEKLKTKRNTSNQYINNLQKRNGKTCPYLKLISTSLNPEVNVTKLRVEGK